MYLLKSKTNQNIVVNDLGVIVKGNGKGVEIDDYSYTISKDVKNLSKYLTIEKISDDESFVFGDIKTLQESIKDLSIELYYSDNSGLNKVIHEIDCKNNRIKLPIDKTKMIKALKLVNLPEGVVEYHNYFSTIFGSDADGKMQGNSNPAWQEQNPDVRYEYLGKLDPMLGKKKLDIINDLPVIECNFNMNDVIEVALPELQKYFPTVVSIPLVRHSIRLYNNKGEIVKTIEVDCRN